MSRNNENCHKINRKKNYKTVQNVKEGILNNTPNTKEAQMEKLEEDLKIVIVLQFWKLVILTVF